MKNIIVTGCLGGIGAAVVRILLENGYSVTGMDVADAATAAQMFSAKDFAYVQGDLSSAADRSRVVDHARARFSRIDGLVNVAGVAPRVRNDVLEMTEESYDFVMNINTKGTLFLTQAVANVMKNNAEENGVRGYICNISSMSAYTSSTSRGEYCISKAGISMITKLFAARLAEYSVSVIEIRPGIIETDMTAKVKEKYEKLIDGGITPIKRMGQPEDIAKCVLSVAQGNFDFCTGTVIDCDGGFNVRVL